MFKNQEELFESAYFPGKLPGMFLIMSADAKGPARLTAAMHNASEDSILYIAGDKNHTASSKNYLINLGFPENQILTEKPQPQTYQGAWRAYLDITRAFESFSERDITLVTDDDLLECHEDLAQKLSSKRVEAISSGYKGSIFRHAMAMLETSALLNDLQDAKRHNYSLNDAFPEFTRSGQRPASPQSLVQYLRQLLR